MQQTEKRGFNIIETSDPFSPDALNDNTRKIEAALDAHEAAVQAVTDDLDARLQVFEAKKFVCGTFFAGGDPLTVDIGFTPELVFIQQLADSPYHTLLLTSAAEPTWILKIVEGGFQVNFFNGYTTHGGTYNFFALA